MAAPLLRTKLFIPPIHSEIVTRPRLIERVNAALRGKLTLISAPAGFGKTTLLSEWTSDLDQPLAWFSIDQGDNDPIRFWTYVVAAIQSVQPGCGENMLAALQTNHPPPIESLLVKLINELSTIPDLTDKSPSIPRVILILDDYHLITEPKIHDALVFFLDNLPQNMHLIISGRADPPWPMARMRARRKMVELRAEDLRFSSQEIATFLNSVMRLDISPEDITALEKHTEGWIVGLQMAALSMQKRSDISAFIRSFTGTNRYILDYLLEEVLDQQPAEIQAFLLKTSLIDQMTAPLCNFLLDGSDSQVILAQLEQANLFLSPLDGERKWYRYHHLFLDLLRNQLTLTYPDEVPQLHMRASQWLEEQGFVDEPIAHAIAAQDYERLARLCEKFALSMLRQSKHSTLSTWIEILPTPLVHQNPWLCVYRSWTRHWAGNRLGGEKCLQNAEKLFAEAPPYDEDEQKRLGGSIATVRAHYALVNERLSLAVDQSKKAMQLVPKMDYYTLGTAGVALGGAYWGQGKIVEAEQAFLECASTALKGGYTPRAASALCYAGIQQVRQAQLEKAERTYRQALSLAQGPGEQRYPVAGYPLAKLSELSCEWNHLQQARELAEEGVKLCILLGHVDLIAEAYAAQARVQLALADFTSARATLQLADQLSADTKLDPWAVSWLNDCRIQLWLSTGRLDRASHWAATSRLDIDGEFSYHHDLHHIILARIMVAQLIHHHPDAKSYECLKLLARLITVTEKMGWVHHQIQALILQALVLETTHASGEALQALDAALQLAQPAGYVRTFISHGKPLDALLIRLSKQQKTNRYIQKLLKASSQESGLMEPLSPRETEVLELLTTSLSVPEIADELVLSANTVRSHIKNIYGKLGVNRRLDAIQKARENELV